MAIGARNKVGASGRARREAFVNALAGVTEAAYLAAAADGVVTDEEYALIANLIVERCEGNVTVRAVGEILQACAESLAEEGFDAAGAKLTHHALDAPLDDRMVRAVAGDKLLDHGPQRRRRGDGCRIWDRSARRLHVRATTHPRRPRPRPGHRRDAPCRRQAPGTRA